MELKKLYLIRHAKSDWSKPGLGDLQRPLNKRGQSDAPMMARRLKQQGVHPDLILSSPAVRALTTASIFAVILNYSPENIQTDMIIYGGDARDYLQRVQSIDNANNEVLLFGHNPDITAFAETMTGESFSNLPTASVVGISFPSKPGWKGIRPHGGTLLFYIYPKMYR